MMQYIQFRWCDWSDRNKNEVSLKQGSKHEFCYHITNSHKTETISVENFFVDANLDGEYHLCNAPESRTHFGQYVTGHTSPVSIGPGETKEIKSTLTYPNTFIGQFAGCLSYNVGGEWSGMFTMRVGRAKLISVEIEGKLSLEFLPTVYESKDNLIKHKNISITKDEVGKYYMKVGFENPGNVTQKVTLSGQVTDMRGEPILILSGEELSVDALGQNSLTRPLTIPWYQGKFDVSIDITHTPFFLFDNDEITDEMKESKSFSHTWNFIIIPRWILMWLLLPFALWRTLKLIKKIRHKKKLQKQQGRKAPNNLSPRSPQGQYGQFGSYPWGFLIPQQGQWWFPPQGQQWQWFPPQGQQWQWFPPQGQQWWFPPQGQQRQWFPPQGQQRQWFPPQGQQWQWFPPQGQR